MIKVIVNDVSLDLKSDAVIALTRKVADIGTLQSRFSSFTNKFQVKATKKNRDALGIKQYQDTSDSISAGIATPYQELTGKLISNGIEIATNVAVIIESVAEDITLSIRAGNGSLFDKLNRTKLSALDYSDIDLLVDSRYNLGNVYDFRNNDWTQSFVYPIHDTGVQSTQNSSIVAKGILPFYYVKDVYQRIATLFGYSWTGSTFTSDFFQRLMLPAARFDITNDFASQFVINLNIDDYLIFDVLVNRVVVVFDQTIISDTFNLTREHRLGGYTVGAATTWAYAAPFVGNYTFEFNYDINTRKEFTAASATIDFYIVQRNSSNNITFEEVPSRFVYQKRILTTTSNVVTNYTGTVTGEFACENANEDFSKNTSDYFCIFICNDIDFAANPSTFWVGGDFEITSVRAEQTTWNRWLQWANHLPDITIAKFIKEVGNIFGAVYDVDEFRKEIEITRLDEIATNRDEAVDWSDKLDLSNPHEVTYIVDGIGKTTSWQWKKTDAYTFSVSVINEQLPENENYVKSDAEYSEERSILLMPSPSTFIPVWDESARRINLNGDLRFAIARDVNNFFLRYSPSLVNENYKVAYFDYDNSPYSLDWSRLYSEYYQGLFEPMTWYMNKVVADFKLNDLDIQSFKFKYPVYIKHFNRYFYVNEISEYTGKDQSTKCTLIAI
jgi:hypothetical protein